MKKNVHFLCLIIMLVMLVMAIPLNSPIFLKVDAAAALVTQSEAVNWAKNQVGKRYDIDGIYGSQCADFASAYINWLISGSTALNKPLTTYNGYKYFDYVNYPEGWQKIRNYLELIPQPGDILVWGTNFGGGYGHVAVAVEGCTINTIKCVEQNGLANGGNGSPVQYATYNYNGFTGVVRPQWKSQVFPSKPNAKASKSVYQENEMVTISWDKCSNVNWFDVEIVNTETGALVHSRNSNNTNAEMTFLTTTLGIGDYRAKITSVNSYGGTIQATPSDYVWFSVKPNTYANSIHHWLWGFKNGEGNNNDKNAFKIASSSFEAEPNSSYIMDKSRAVKLPKGIALCNNFGTSGIDGTWKKYPFGTSVTQKSLNMGFEYDYEPITYKITYDLAGGTNNSANPTSYNVLYGVTLKNPTRTGYTFADWYNGSTKVTGINEGKNAVFANADALYTELAKRQTGDVKLTAKWTPNTYTVKYNANGGGGAPENQIKTHDVNLMLNSTKPTRSGYTFLGWATTSAASAADYQSGASFTLNADITLYAVWKANLKIDEMNFPDATFRSYISEKFDLDGDLGLSLDELSAVRSIDVYQKSIADLKGVEYFTELEYLNCAYNNLSSLDVSGCTALRHLSCSSNRLSSLDVSKNMMLRYLYCSSNQLSSLNVSNCTALTELNCNDNRLTDLDLGTKVKVISINSQISSLKIQKTSNSWSVDLSKLVGAENLNKVALKEGQDWQYDAAIGMAFYTGKGVPEKLVYYYNGNNLSSKDMDVTVELLKSEEKQPCIVMKQNAEQAYINGIITATTQYAAGHARMENVEGTMQLPLRYIAEVNGFTVDYDENTYKTKVTDPMDGSYLLITPNSETVTKYAADGTLIGSSDAPLLLLYRMALQWVHCVLFVNLWD